MTAIPGIVSNAKFGIESSWGSEATADKIFGANIKVSNASTNNALNLKRSIGTPLPVANIEGPYTGGFTLDFDLIDVAKGTYVNVDWLQSLYGAPVSTYTFNQTNVNSPKSLTIILTCDVSAGASADVEYYFLGCYCNSAKFDFMANDLIHCTADFVPKSSGIDETVTLASNVASAATAYNFTQIVVSNVGAVACAVESFTVTISRDEPYRHGIGTRLPQAIVNGGMKFTMDATILYEKGTKIINFGYGGATPFTQATPHAYSLPDTVFVVTVTGVASTLTFTSAVMKVASLNMSVEQGGVVKQDVSLEGTLITVVVG